MNTNNIVWHNSTTPLSVHFNDVYFNSDGAIAETYYVFVEANKLNQRFLAHTESVFTIGETGFGSGLNFLIIWQQFLAFRRLYPEYPLKKLQFFSIEKYPLLKTELHAIYKTLFNDHELVTFAKQIEDLWPRQDYQFIDVNLTIFFSDISIFSTKLASYNAHIDAWLFDGFSPNKNPDMWSEELFLSIYQHTKPNGTFATFTAAGQVRRNLINAGFQVEKHKGYGKKREMLVGYKPA